MSTTLNEGGGGGRVWGLANNNILFVFMIVANILIAIQRVID